jgi:hypothetical protein
VQLSSLVHLIGAASSLTQSDRVIVLGSAALLATHATLGEAGAPLELTRDADLWLEPCDEELAAMLHEALGEGSLFDQHFGYHLDVLRPSIADTFAEGWALRTQAVAGTNARALSAVDVAAVKLRVGRPKDEALVAQLFASRLVEPDDVAELLRKMHWSEAEMHQTILRWGRLALTVR